MGRLLLDAGGVLKKPSKRLSAERQSRCASTSVRTRRILSALAKAGLPQQRLFDLGQVGSCGRASAPKTWAVASTSAARQRQNIVIYPLFAEPAASLFRWRHFQYPRSAIDSAENPPVKWLHIVFTHWPVIIALTSNRPISVPPLWRRLRPNGQQQHIGLPFVLAFDGGRVRVARPRRVIDAAVEGYSRHRQWPLRKALSPSGLRWQKAQSTASFYA